MGYATYEIELDEHAISSPYTAYPMLDEAGRGMVTSTLAVQVDPACGGVVSLVDKASGREFVAAGQVLGRYLYQTFDADDPQRYIAQYATGTYPWIEGDFGKPGLPPSSEVRGADVWQQDCELRFEDRGGSMSAIMTAEPGEAMPHRTRLAVTVYEGQQYIDLDWSIIDKPATSWPEAGWLCLPFAVNRPSYRLGRVGAIIDPAQDIQPAGNVDVFCLSSGMTIAGPRGKLVGICPLDSPLVSIGRPGLWRFSREFNPRRPTVYVNLFNNQWSTNFSQWVQGSWSSSVRIWVGHKSERRGTDESGNPVIAPALTESDLLSRASAETRTPVLAAFADGPAGTLPPRSEGLSVSRSGVAVTAFGANPDGPGTLLRVWEQAGGFGWCSITLPSGAARRSAHAQPCDLRGRPVGSPIAIVDGRFDFELPASSPASFILEPASR